MKNIYLFLLLFTTIAFLQSCQKEIEFDSKLIEPKMVINGFIQQDSLISITIGTSKAILGIEKPTVWINDASVKLYVDGVEKETLSTYNIVNSTPNYNSPISENPKTGYRSLSTTAEAGKTYKLVVSHPNYKTVTCETTIPVPIKIEGIDTTTNTSVSNGYSSSEFLIKIRFKDPQGEKNYYRLVYKSLSGMAITKIKTSNGFSDTIQISEQTVGTNISSNDPIINPSEEDANDFLFGSPSNTYNLFTDDYLEGKEYELSFYISSYYITLNTSKIDTSIGEFFKLDVELQSITREAYLYMKSVNAYNYYNGDLFSEPVQVFTNIENGIGIFAGYSSSLKIISRGEYPIEGVNYQTQNNGYYYYLDDFSY